MNKDEIVQANLTLILAIIILLNFADNEIGTALQPWEQPWLKITHLLVLTLFLLSALSLFLSSGTCFFKNNDNIVRKMILYSEFFLFFEFVLLFIILIRFMISKIIGIE